MLGWNVSVYRQTDDGASPAAMGSPQKVLVLRFGKTDSDGLGWLDGLVKAGKAIDLGGDGYPLRYTVTAEHLIPRIIDNPPAARSVWICDASDILTDKWEGTTVVDLAAVADCHPDEWLLIEAYGTKAKSLNKALYASGR